MYCEQLQFKNADVMPELRRMSEHQHSMRNILIKHLSGCLKNMPRVKQWEKKKLLKWAKHWHWKLNNQPSVFRLVLVKKFHTSYSDLQHILNISPLAHICLKCLLCMNLSASMHAVFKASSHVQKVASLLHIYCVPPKAISTTNLPNLLLHVKSKWLDWPILYGT